MFSAYSFNGAVKEEEQGLNQPSIQIGDLDALFAELDDPTANAEAHQAAPSPIYNSAPQVVDGRILAERIWADVQRGISEFGSQFGGTDNVSYLTGPPTSAASITSLDTGDGSFLDITIPSVAPETPDAPLAEEARAEAFPFFHSTPPRCAPEMIDPLLRYYYSGEGTSSGYAGNLNADIPVVSPFAVALSTDTPVPSTSYAPWTKKTMVHEASPTDMSATEKTKSNHREKLLSVVRDTPTAQRRSSSRRKERCPHCDKVLVKKNIKRHIDSVHRRIKYPCVICQAQFSCSSDVGRHQKSMHPQIYARLKSNRPSESNEDGELSPSSSQEEEMPTPKNHVDE